MSRRSAPELNGSATWNFCDMRFLRYEPVKGRR